jgi:Protein of unknown function (DUF4058)
VPLLDHFHSPQLRCPWESVFSCWTTRLADALNDDEDPQGFLAAEHQHYPDSFEVRVFSTTRGLTLVAAIELISPANKDRPEERRAFATKCASYLHQGVSLIIIDVVTNRRANLHNDVVRTLAVGDEFLLADEQNLYAVAYRPVLRQERAQIDLWTEPCAVGEPLPTMPLRLTGDLFVPVDFETAYRETCRRRRLA